MKHQTSIRVSKRLHFYFRELQLSQKITISKIIFYISENYNQQTSIQGKNHKKEKREAGKREKRGGEVYHKKRDLKHSTCRPL